MKVVGIIAEYNPFHNGHAYQIEKARELSGADYVVAAMSGNYVQRGFPAITDKFSRASMALSHGADLVFELPVLWATASAESFAAAGVALFDRLGFVDGISFGCETENFSLLTSVARILSEEPEDFSLLLAEQLKQGKNFPFAREQAIFSYLKQHPDTVYEAFPSVSPAESAAKIHEILSSPNNILALEYIKALTVRSSDILPYPVMRTGAGYHDVSWHPAFSSASAIRNALSAPSVSSSLKDMLIQNVPKDVAACLLNEHAVFLSEEDFSEMLYYKLFSERSNGYAEYGDSSVFLSNRMKNLLDSYLGYDDFCHLVKTRDVTHTRISRLLLHILLNIHNEDYSAGKALDYIPYFRLLGFRKEASFLLKEIKNKSLPLITKPAQGESLLPADAKFMYELDITASNLYYGILAQKKKCAEKNEYQREMIII